MRHDLWLFGVVSSDKSGFIHSFRPCCFEEIKKSGNNKINNFNKNCMEKVRFNLPGVFTIKATRQIRLLDSVSALCE